MLYVGVQKVSATGNKSLICSALCWCAKVSATTKKITAATTTTTTTKTTLICNVLRWCAKCLCYRKQALICNGLGWCAYCYCYKKQVFNLQCFTLVCKNVFAKGNKPSFAMFQGGVQTVIATRNKSLICNVLCWCAKGLCYRKQALICNVSGWCANCHCYKKQVFNLQCFMLVCKRSLLQETSPHLQFLGWCANCHCYKKQVFNLQCFTLVCKRSLLQETSPHLKCFWMVYISCHSRYHASIYLVTTC